MLAVDHESQTLLHRAALSRDVSTIRLLAEKRYAIRNININGNDNSGRTAKQRLQTVDPSAELLKAFTAMIEAIESAKQTVQVEGAFVRHSDNDQDVFKDAIEYQSAGSPTSSCHTTDNEKLPAATRRKRSARLAKPLNKIGGNWASKYRRTFRSFNRHLHSASASKVTLIDSRPNG